MIIKVVNPNIISQAYIKLAKVNRGGSLKNRENIIIYNNDLMEEYLELRQQQTKNVNERKWINKIIKELKEKNEDNEKLKEKMKKLKDKNEDLKNKLSFFKSIESVPTYLEEIGMIF